MFKFKKKTLIIVSSVSLSILILSLCAPPLSNPVLSIFKQPLNLFISIGREFQGMLFYHRNFAQNERLKKQVDFLNNKLNALEEISRENVRLKNLLSFSQNSPSKLVAAKVIARSPGSWNSSVIIDKGRSERIRRGMAVVTFLGLVGRVIEAQEHTSKVLLLTDPSLSVSAIVQRSRQEGLVSGTLGTYLIMKYLPEESDVDVHDTILTSGLNEVYPKGIIIGTVVSIGKEFSGLSRYAIIKPAVSLSGIEEVLVIVS